MTRAHLARLPGGLRERAADASVLKEFVGRSGGFADPYGGDVARYRKLHEEMEPVLRDLLDKLLGPDEAFDSEPSTDPEGP